MGCTDVSCLNRTLDRLDEIAPDVPVLALGQTIFWDEPLKAGVAMALRRRGSLRRFVAGVHDTDYFAKNHADRNRLSPFKALPHNDTTTKGFWSAAGEFSALFGSETVVTRETLLQGGLKLDRLRTARPGFLDEATEAWGWRGLASLSDHPPVTADVKVAHVLPALKSTFSWALQESLASLTGEARRDAEDVALRLQTELCDAADVTTTVSELYRAFLPTMYEAGPGVRVDIDVSATTEILRFNRSTASQSRFRLVDLFVRPETRWVAAQAYDEAVKGSGLYGLSRFGTGAVPFDLYIPGKGRGTVRIGNRGIVIQTPRPEFISLKRPVGSVEELAGLMEDKFGPNCTLVGKAVTLIGMLASEFIFVFHEGASSYVKHSRRLHQMLNERLAAGLVLHPILRIRYATWDALRVTCAWFRVPSPLQRPFGSEEMCSPSLGMRWQEVGARQEELLGQLGKLRRPIDLIEFLDREVGGSWKRIAEEYRALREHLSAMEATVDQLRTERHETLAKLRRLRAAREEAERAKGDHFRQHIFEREATASDLAQREALTQEVERIVHEIAHTRVHVHELMSRQRAAVEDRTVQQVHVRRRDLELEAELKRVRMIRDAVVASRGMRQANLRPCAWWFPLVSPDGLWFRETVDTASCYLEDLV